MCTFFNFLQLCNFGAHATTEHNYRIVYMKIEYLAHFSSNSLNKNYYYLSKDSLDS